MKPDTSIFEVYHEHVHNRNAFFCQSSWNKCYC